MSRHFWLDGGSIHTSVLVVLGDPAYYEKVMKLCNVPEDERSTHGYSGMHHMLSAKDGATFHVVWVSGKPWTIDWFETVVHEVSHLVDYILQRRSIPPGIESTEVRACLTGYYNQEIFAKVRGIKPLSKKNVFGVRA